MNQNQNLNMNMNMNRQPGQAMGQAQVSVGSFAHVVDIFMPIEFKYCILSYIFWVQNNL